MAHDGGTHVDGDMFMMGGGNALFSTCSAVINGVFALNPRELKSQMNLFLVFVPSQ